MVGDVLDLVRDRARVDLAQPRQHVEQRLAGNVEPEQLRGDPRLQLGGERRAEPGLVERRVAHRLRPEGVEPRVQVAVRPEGLHERHRGRDTREQLLVDPSRRRDLLDELLARCGARGRGLLLDLVHQWRRLGLRWRGRWRRLDRGRDGDRLGRSRDPAVPLGARLDETGEPGERGENVPVTALEELAPFGIDGLRILEVLLEQRADVARVEIGLPRGDCHDSFVPGSSLSSSLDGAAGDRIRDEASSLPPADSTAERV